MGNMLSETVLNRIKQEHTRKHEKLTINSRINCSSNSSERKFNLTSINIKVQFSMVVRASLNKKYQL
jgi:hypothetical protein